MESSEEYEVDAGSESLREGESRVKNREFCRSGVNGSKIR